MTPDGFCFEARAPAALPPWSRQIRPNRGKPAEGSDQREPELLRRAYKRDEDECNRDHDRGRTDRRLALR
jgi:hypothetical protein